MTPQDTKRAVLLREVDAKAPPTESGTFGFGAGP